MKLVYTYALGAYAIWCAGSSPVSGTRLELYMGQMPKLNKEIQNSSKSGHDDSIEQFEQDKHDRARKLGRKVIEVASHIKASGRSIVTNLEEEYEKDKRDRVDRIKEELKLHEESDDPARYDYWDALPETEKTRFQKIGTVVFDRLGIKTKRGQETRNREALGVAQEEIESENRKLYWDEIEKREREQKLEKQRRIKEAIEKGPLTPEQKKEQLSFDKLSKLSTEEYLTLWLQLNPFFVSHTTRQGIRDHSGGTHMAGMGEWHNGLINILKSKKIVSPLATVMGTDGQFEKQNVAQYLKGDLHKNFPKNGLFDQLNEDMADRGSIHFMCEAVGNREYGAEEGNECFFVFPADVIASQCKYAPESTTNFKNSALITDVAGRDSIHNNLYVYPPTNGDAVLGSIPIDAGLVFLPKSTIVDPSTGSKYATKEITDENGITKRISEGHLVENGIKAEEYYENYFAEHPEQRPAHIIYYDDDGGPTNAVGLFLAKENIIYDTFESLRDGQKRGPGDVSLQYGDDLGFEENNIKKHNVSGGVPMRFLIQDNPLKKFIEKFNNFAKEIIDEEDNHESSNVV